MAISQLLGRPIALITETTMRTTLKLVAAAILGLLILCTPAAAQSPGYPGPTTTVAPEPTAQVRGEGSIRSGETKEFDDCGFAPNSTATGTFNGEDAGTFQADSSGCIHVTVTCSDDGCRTVSINGRAFAARNANELVIRGTGSNGAPRTYTNRFAVVFGASGGRRGQDDGAARGDLPRTGATVLRWLPVGAGLIVIGSAALVIERRRLRRRAA